MLGGIGGAVSHQYTDSKLTGTLAGLGSGAIAGAALLSISEVTSGSSLSGGALVLGAIAGGTAGAIGGFVAAYSKD